MNAQHMIERPILFSAPMVRALLDGSKTQTRRVCKPAEVVALSHVGDCGSGEFGDEEGDVRFTSPYGQPGDRLWVRETWAPHPDFPETRGRAVYRADPECKYDVDRWRPSIHMPRWASRILLEIVSVRVEQLQDIGTEDVEAEGIVTSDASIMEHGCRARVIDFANLWEQINGAGSWDANPWVWVVEFKRVTP